MGTPQADYRVFWQYAAVGVALFLIAWSWLLCAYAAIGGMKHKTLGRIIYALVCGPLALGAVWTHPGKFQRD